MTVVAHPPFPPTTDRLPPLEAGDRLDQPTFHARYKQMPPGLKAELIGGIVYMPSPVSRRHGRPHGDLLFCLVYYRTFTPGVDTSDNGTTILGDDSEPQPDAFMRIETGGQSRLNEEDYAVGCPELVCEVANSSVSYDMHAKRDDYERYGALEYFAAVVREARVARFARRDGKLVEVPPDADGLFRSTAFPGFWLDPAALLRGDTRQLMEVLNQGIATPEHAAFVASLGSR
jgi:Uma2 family endonuclease